ncbi:MAG TPA: nucleoside recognition protein [Deltaproteobacteria bacterium]|nr:nucleoside recognition protein [Deltaproteobacteria bacterium]
MTAHSKVKYRALLLSLALSVVILLFGFNHINPNTFLNRLLWPLCRLMFLISFGLIIGQIIESSGWTRILGAWVGPVFRFGNLNAQCGAAFTTAFFSGVAANSMLLGFYKEGRVSRMQLFLTNFINQFPAYFLHLPTTLFIVIPLTGRAGILYFAITFLAVLLRTVIFLLYGHLSSSIILSTDQNLDNSPYMPASNQKKSKTVWKEIRDRFPGRITNITIYVVPVYILVFVLNASGVFSFVRTWLAGYITTEFVPVESLSFVILSFAAEFTSGFAAAGALMNAGMLTIKQTVLALLAGNIIAFPIRAIRHQLPRYIGIFSPKMGTQLLLMGQGLRVLSLMLVGAVYFYFG